CRLLGPGVVLFRRFVARLGYRFDTAGKEILKQRIHKFSVGVRHLLLREHVSRSLVFSNLENVWIDAQLIERAAEEHHVSRKANSEKVARRRQKNTIARRGDVVVLVETHFHEGIDRFAGSPKVSNR